MPSKTRFLALIAALSAANVAFRFVLAGGPPNVKPTTFLVILAGITGGPVAGFAVGWLSMTISDIAAFGAGIWTIETSAFMALVGLISGFVWHRAASVNRWKLVVGGFALTMLFDIGTSVVDALVFNYPVYAALLALYVPFLAGAVSPWPFGVAHELTTAVLMAVLAPSLIQRIRKIYQ